MDTPTLSSPPTPSYAATLDRLRANFEGGLTRPYAWRRAQLEAMLRMVNDNEDAILGALAADLSKPSFEAKSSEVSYVRGELTRTLKSLSKWMKPEPVATDILVQPGRSRIHHDPLGVVLVIAPWNFPIQLALAPMVGALAGGNCMILKPSELAPASSRLLAELIPRYLPPEAVTVVEGGVPETTALLELRFDHIFFTGSPRVGRVIMAAAARHLTPVTLELGGKSPVIVDQHTRVDIAAKRICWGKFTNAGQVCLAPDYLLVHDAVYEQTIDALRSAIHEFYGPDPRQSPDFARVVSPRHAQRLAAMLEGANIVVGGEVEVEARYVAPTLIRDVDDAHPLMAEEIFGPLLPVCRIGSIDEAIRKVNARPKPLALYLFSDDERAREAVIERTSSGGVTINHAWMHVAVSELPFGGVGESGMGAYHGRASFTTFTHQKSVLTKPIGMDVPVMYPPYSPLKEAIVDKLL